MPRPGASWTPGCSKFDIWTVGLFRDGLDRPKQGGWIITVFAKYDNVEGHPENHGFGEGCAY